MKVHHNNCVTYISLICFTIFNLIQASGQHLDSYLKQLDEHVEKRPTYDRLKLERIDDLKRQLVNLPEGKRFDVYANICNEYKTFIYDSAFVYARKLQNEAYRTKDPEKIASSKITLGFILLSSGMFNEALDSLSSINRNIPDSLKIEFYSVIGRTYYDLVDFNRDKYFTQRYTALGNEYIDSALMLCDKQSSRYYSLHAMKNLRMENLDIARADLEHLINSFPLDDPQIGIAASTLGYIYQRDRRNEESMIMLAKAAIADNRASIKETLAILNLAELLYKQGDVSRAYQYVKIAMEDANYYGARHRKIQVGAIFPIIEGNKLDTVEHQRRLLLTYAILVTVLVILVVAFSLIIYRQFKKIKAADQIIQSANENLRQANHLLQDTNRHLHEANKIKEEYIGYYFNINSEYLVKIEAFKRAIENKLIAKKYDDIRFVVNNINLKREREELYYSFDKVFLKLFPDFVSTFNSFFKEEDRIILKEGQLLNTELRIFALIRMGIHDSEKIAKILDYSINTIYNYKARVKNKSIIPNEDFERRIMEIEAI